MHCHSPSGSLFYTALSSSNEANQNVRSSLNKIYAFINFLAGSYIQPSSKGAGQGAMKTMMTTTKKTTTTMETIQQSRKAVHIQKNGSAFMPWEISNFSHCRCRWLLAGCKWVFDDCADNWVCAFRLIRNYAMENNIFTWFSYTLHYKTPKAHPIAVLIDNTEWVSSKISWNYSIAYAL